MVYFDFFLNDKINNSGNYCLKLNQLKSNIPLQQGETTCNYSIKVIEIGMEYIFIFLLLSNKKIEYLEAAKIACTISSIKNRPNFKLIE